MGEELFKECLTCGENVCCKWEVSCPLFVTEGELLKINETNKSDFFNKTTPCAYLNEKNLCKVHQIRPADCKFFPFDFLEIGGEFYWVFWELPCPILGKEYSFEEYLKKFEKELLPSFKNILSEYSKFRLEEFLMKYRFRIIRKVILN